MEVIYYYFLCFKKSKESVFKQALIFFFSIKDMKTKFRSLLNDINMTLFDISCTSFLPLMKDAPQSHDIGVDHVNHFETRAINVYFNIALARDTFLFNFWQKKKKKEVVKLSLSSGPLHIVS